MECKECGAALTPGARFCASCGGRIQIVQDASDPLREALERAIGFQYRIERPLGRGGMGAVYLAHELALDRDVAIKVLPPEQADAPQLRERFRSEARTAARLNHPNIVPLYTFGEVNGLVYFVMGYVEGESLASRLRRDGPLPSDQARTLLAELADALAYAHRQGVIHRDIKPDNILIDADTGSPRLTDFGIAKASFSDAQLTTAGQLIGTPAYMSPEQALGRPDVDARSDIYSLGIVGYEMLSGRLPFEGDTPMDMVTQRLTQQPKPLRTVAPKFSHDLIVAIDRCLESDPAKRWPDAKSLRFELAPSEDEIDDPLIVRNLRMATFAVSLASPTLVSSAIFARFYHGPIRGVAFALISASITFLLMIVVATLTLLRQGYGIRTVIQAAFRQPRGWRFWYPSRFRRRGDVWDRLPAPMKRVRLHFALFFAFMFGIYLPLFFGLLLSRGPDGLQGLQLVPFVVIPVLFMERRRAMKQISMTLKTSMAEASKIMSTPTWRTSAWQRGPAATLIFREAVAGNKPPVERAAGQARPISSGDRPTLT